MSVFSDRLNDLINERKDNFKYKKKEFASFVGVHENTILNYTKDKTFPRGEELLKIAQYFDVDVRHLIDKEFKNKTSPSQDIRKETGLTEKSIKVLKQLKKPSIISNEKETKTFHNTIFEEGYNSIIESDFFIKSSTFTSMMLDLNKLDNLIENIEINVSDKKNVDKNGVKVYGTKKSKADINKYKKIVKESIIKEIDSIIEELNKFTFKYSFKLMKNNNNEYNDFYKKIKLWKALDKEKNITEDFCYYFDSIGLVNYLETQKDVIEDVLYFNEVKRFLKSTIAKSVMVIKSELKDRYSNYLRKF